MGSPESPIEQMMLDALPDDLVPESATVNGEKFRRHFYLSCQFHVVLRKYRTDFLFWEVLPDGDFTPGIVIECDGHDFHEKTAAQAHKDKLRDRRLQADGFTVLHFTGSEIYKDPTACWCEISIHIERQWNAVGGQ